MNLELNGKIALITGGTTGIGRAVAEGLAREKTNIILCARNGEKALKEADAVAQQYGIRALGLKCDVTRSDDISNITQRVLDEFGGVDILINNAGTGTNEKIIDAPDTQWQYFWDLHVMAAIRFARGLVPAMKTRGGGVIINNASICARQPLGHEPIYNVTKSALAMLTKCMANEFIKDNIRVNSINPGLIETEPWINVARQATSDVPKDWQRYLKKIAADVTPIGRFATPEELADFFVFLCSPRASYCVGSSYYVDGGWLKSVL